MKKIRPVFTALIMWLSLVVTGATLIPDGEWGTGNTIDIVFYNDYVFTASGYGGVDALDVSNPLSPVAGDSLLPFYDTDHVSYVSAVCQSGNYLFLADQGYGVVIINISDPDNMVQEGSVELPYGGNDICISGDYVYVTDGFNLHVINISNKANPVSVYSSESSYNLGATHVNLDGSILITTGQDEISIFNISTPASPVLSGTHENYGYSTGTGDAIISGNYVYVTQPDYMEILDVSIPSSPQSVYFELTEDSGPMSSFLVGTTVFIADDDLAIGSVADVENPEDYGWVETPGESVRVCVFGNYAYLAEGVHGITIVNVANVLSPIIVSTYNHTGRGNSLFVKENTLYVAQGPGGLKTIDFSNVSTPNTLGFFERESDLDDLQQYRRVFVNGNYAYLMATDLINNGVEVLNVSNPAAPSFVSFFTTEWEAWCMDVENGFAFVGGDTGLNAVNLSSPGSLTFAGSTNPGEIISINVDGHTAYLGLSTRLVVVDVSSVSSMSQIGSYTTDFPVNDIWIAGSRAYLATDEGLTILNISNPAVPVFVGKYTTNKSITQVAVMGDVVFAGLASSGLHKINISNESSPSKLAEFDQTPGAVQDITVSGNYAIVSYESGKVHWFNSESSNSGENTAYLPHITKTDYWESFLIADNISSSDSQITVTQYQGGEVFSATSYTIPAGEQRDIQLLVEGCGTVSFNASEILLKETFRSYVDGIAEFAISENTGTTLWFLLPQYNSENLNWSGIAAMNPESISASVTLTAYSHSGSVLGTASDTILPYKKMVGQVSEFFSELNFQDVARIRMTSSTSLTGITISGNGMDRLLFSKAETDVYQGLLPISHIDDSSSNWKNMIIMDNIGTSSVDVTIPLYREGEELDVLTYTIPAGNTHEVNLNSLYTLDNMPQCGFVDVGISQVFVRESFIYQSNDGGTAEFVLTNDYSDKAIFNFPHYFADSLDWMGLSVFNGSSTSEVVIAKAYQNGSVTSQTTLSVPAYSREVGLLTSIFSSLEGTDIERVEITGNVNLSGINISGSGLSRFLFTPAFSVGDPHEEPSGQFIDSIHHIYHSGFWVDYEGMTIYIDPVNIDGLTSRKADIIFITHPFEDHLSLESIAYIADTNTTIVIPNAGSSYLTGYSNIVPVTPGNDYTVKGIDFSTIKAYNALFSGGPHLEALNFVGYFIEFGDNTLYHSGDTDHIDEMSGLNPTVALLPVGGSPEVMTPAEAAAAAQDINPTIAVPMHYDLFGSIADANSFASYLEGIIEVVILPNEQP